MLGFTLFLGWLKLNICIINYQHMPLGISIHIGLDKIDPSHYGTNGILPYCVNDAEALKNLAEGEHYSVRDFLTNEEATATKVLTALAAAADELEPGDILMITYSGHGGFFP